MTNGTSAVDGLRGRVQLAGVGFDPLTEAETVETILTAFQAGRGGWVSTPNTHQLRTLRRSKEERAMVSGASLIVADGMPLVWASRLLGNPLPERVAGSSLVWSLAAGAARHGRTLFLLGGDDGVADRAAQVLTERYPLLKIAGTHCPPFGFERDPTQLEAIWEKLRRANPDIVYVGLGFPKQEHLMIRLREVLPDAWLLGIGISLSFISGDQKRAPRWMQVTGFEWLHRFVNEPERLFRRYLLEGIPFTLGLLLRAWVRGRR